MLLISIQGCSTNGTPIDVLTVPKFVSQSQPDSAQEEGIRQDPKTGGIILQWYSLSNAVGYRLFRSHSTDSTGRPTDFVLLMNIRVSAYLNDTSVIDVNSIFTGIRYYYYFQAYAADEKTSAPSDTVSYELLRRPDPTYPANNISVNPSGLSFTWYDDTGGGYTVIRVKDITPIPGVYVWVTKRFQIFAAYPGTKLYNFDGSANQDLASGHSYQWRVERFDLDGKGKPYEGASSQWLSFTVK
jgi:hypothetical protein